MYSCCNNSYIGSNIPYYTNNIPYSKIRPNHGDRFIGFGLAPFLLGGLAGGALVSAFRPPYPMPYPVPYPSASPMMYPGTGMYPGYGFGYY